MEINRLSRPTGNLGGQISRRVVLLSLTAILALLTAISLGLWGTIQGVQSQLDEVGATTAQEFDDFFGNLRTDMEATSDLMATTENTASVLRRALERQPAIFEVVLANESGQVLAQRRRIGRGPLRIDEQPWLETAKRGEFFISAVSYQEFGVPFVNLAVPVKDETGGFLSTYVARVDLTALWDSIIRQRVGNAGYVYIADDGGLLLAYQDLNLVKQEVTLLELTGRSLRQMQRAVIDIRQGISGAQVIAATIPLHETTWFAVVEQPVLDALGGFIRMAFLFLLLLVGVGFLVRNIVRFTRRRIVQPLGSLRDGVASLTAGDLEQHIRVNSQDELGELADAFNMLGSQLQEVIGSLEQRVEARTRDLEQRNVQMEAAAQVSREAAAIRDVGRLLDATVHLISDKFNFYHAGVFLVDEPREYALLQAVSSDGGQRMLARSHKLQIGQDGIVGLVAASGESRVAQTVGTDAVYFDNPDLPLTRSEIALPLKVRGETIGVLDVQSTEEAAFADEDVAILQTMADQVALAIENANLLTESQQAANELRALYGQRSQRAWRERAGGDIAAYRYSRLGVEAAKENILLKPAQTPVISEQEEGRQLMVPIKVRGKNLGVISLTRDLDHPRWSTNDQALVEAVCAQVGLSLESARLLEETQRRAAQEEMVSDVTARMRETLDIDLVLQTAVREMRQALNLEDVTIRLGQSNGTPTPLPTKRGRS